MTDAKLQTMYGRKLGAVEEERYAVTAASVGDALQLMIDKNISYDEYIIVRRPTYRNGKPYWGRYVFIKYL